MKNRQRKVSVIKYRNYITQQNEIKKLSITGTHIEKCNVIMSRSRQKERAPTENNETNVTSGYIKENQCNVTHPLSPQ